MHHERSEAYKVSPERLWSLIADTDSLNRELGLPQVRYALSPLPQGGSKVMASATKGGMTLEWEEHPFEWIWPRFYSVRRTFTKGPFKEFFSVLTLSREGEGCRMNVAIDLEPRSLLGKIVVGPFTKSNANGFFEAARKFEQYLLGEESTPYPNRFGKSAVDGVQLEAALKKLTEAPVEKPLVEKIGQFIAEEVDERVRDIRPFALADLWNADRLAVLKLCLYGTRTGLLDLRWNVICPSCQGSKGEFDSMKKLSPSHECTSCNIQFRVNFDRTIEARFTPSRAIRTIGPARYCIGGPFNTPHVAAQFLLKAGETRTAEIDLPAARYAVRRIGSLETRPVEVGSGAKESEILLRDGEKGAVEIASPAWLTLKNPGDATIRVTIEREEREEPYATAHAVTSLQEFRDLYATEALAPGVELTIGSLAVFFSDLKGSTAMYEKIGDAPAYAVVRKHFDFMTERIRVHRGAIVKTMGDAVMAVFRNPADALRAALTIQQDAGQDGTGIKIGIHQGPCIAVSSVDYLDYFGTTVNVAQRTQGQSVGGDIVVTDAIMGAPGVADALREADAHESTFTASLKGLESQFTLHRLALGKVGETRLRVTS